MMIPDTPTAAAFQQQYREMMQLYSAAVREVRTKVEILDEEFRTRYAHNPIHHIDSRLKSPQSMMKKLARKGLPQTLEAAEANLNDIAGVRIVCNYLDDIYRIADLLQRQRDVEFVHRRDYIENPKESGYRSLHLVIRIPVFLSSHTELVPVEVQIRTIAMDFWASLEHQLRYKSNHETTQQLRRRLQHCAEASAALDREMQDIYREINGYSAGEMQPVQAEADDAAPI
ncbi:MAG: GTP pyrophosphokinase family protein [Aristaeellaceae bacterium]